jgi:hypothetical protein
MAVKKAVRASSPPAVQHNLAGTSAASVPSPAAKKKSMKHASGTSCIRLVFYFLFCFVFFSLFLVCLVRVICFPFTLEGFPPEDYVTYSLALFYENKFVFFRFCVAHVLPLILFYILEDHKERQKEMQTKKVSRELMSLGSALESGDNKNISSLTFMHCSAAVILLDIIPLYHFCLSHAMSSFIQQNSTQGVRSCLVAGADVNGYYCPPDRALCYGPRYLTVAISNNAVEVSKILIQYGADVNSYDDFDSSMRRYNPFRRNHQLGAVVANVSALHFASRHNFTGLVQLLLLNGASVDALHDESICVQNSLTDDQHWYYTPLDFALHFKSEAAAALLRSHGVSPNKLKNLD